MKFLKRKLLGALLVLAMPALLSAQIKFKIDYDAESERYAVSIVPEQTLEFPNNLTGSGQVSLKVPTGLFDLADFQNADPKFIWEMNSRTDSPTEALDYDYLSFGLNSTTTKDVTYIAGTPRVLFTFKNAQGCTGPVKLVENETEEFMAPNSQHVNIGNQLTVMGIGLSAYGGVVDGGVADCAPELEEETPFNPGSQLPTATTHNVLTVGDFTLFPNPTVDYINVSFDWTADRTDGELVVLDEAGKSLLVLPQALAQGENTLKVRVDHLAAGAYLLSLRGSDWSTAMGGFVKE